VLTKADANTFHTQLQVKILILVSKESVILAL
ncbi:MAG: hypothetical protein RIR48_291, partial [Bacteroidota bacterium]